jgi:ribonuclease E
VIAAVEQRCGVNVVLVPNPHLDMPKYEIQRLREDEMRQPGAVTTSYKMVTEPSPTTLPPSAEKPREAPEQPAVKGIEPATPAPVSKVEPRTGPGLFTRMWRALFGSGEKRAPERERSREGRPQRQESSRRDHRDRDRGRGRDGHNRGRDRDRSRDRDRGPRPQQAHNRRDERPSGRPPESRPAPQPLNTAAPAAEAPVRETAPAQTTGSGPGQSPASGERPGGESGQRRGRRRGRRGGRRRRFEERGQPNDNRGNVAEPNLAGGNGPADAPRTHDDVPPAAAPERFGNQDDDRTQRNPYADEPARPVQIQAVESRPAPESEPHE